MRFVIPRRSDVRTLIVPLLVIRGGAAVTAQSPVRPAFQAASINPNTSSARLVTAPRFSTRLVVATNAPLAVVGTV